MSIMTSSEQRILQRRGSVRIVASVLAALIASGLLGWLGWLVHGKLERTDVRLEALSQGLQRLADKQESLETGLRQSREQTLIAREQAHAAAERADKSDAARVEVLREAEQAQAARALADQQAEHARRQAQSAREELDLIRKARQDELNRMQEALSKVALTRRTPDGMVIDLSNDSFKFDFDKATLRPENRELLSRLAGILLASHGYRLDVYGYTDDIGSDEYNQGLSERRAKAVQDYLVKVGLPLDIMTTKGFGKTSPRVQAKTAEAREKNRRVEIGIVDTVIKYAGEPHQP
jgi:outer membrane protein OmpA-like peptidoglycan-associated protein